MCFYSHRRRRWQRGYQVFSRLPTSGDKSNRKSVPDAKTSKLITTDQYSKFEYIDKYLYPRIYYAQSTSTTTPITIENKRWKPIEYYMLEVGQYRNDRYRYFWPKISAISISFIAALFGLLVCFTQSVRILRMKNLRCCHDTQRGKYTGTVRCAMIVQWKSYD